MNTLAQLPTNVQVVLVCLFVGFLFYFPIWLAYQLLKAHQIHRNKHAPKPRCIHCNDTKSITYPAWMETMDTEPHTQPCPFCSKEDNDCTDHDHK